jgi:hypothetical protein
MNSETPFSETTRPVAKGGTTLQAILQASNGDMDSIAVPVPLPDVILRVQSASSGTVEMWFRRARSADSVLRYVQEEGSGRATASDAALAAPERRCARCHGGRSIYYIPKLAQNEPVTPETAAYCAECYGAAAT